MTTETKFTFDPSIEPLLQKNDDRFVLYPIKHLDIFTLAKESFSNIWTVEDIDFTRDINDWKNKLNDNERFFIKNVLAFFASSDGIVNENLNINFADEVQWPEARYLYGIQQLIEHVHSETYSMTINTYIQDPDERNILFNALKTNPIVKKKAEWAFKWFDRNTRSFAERLVAFGAVEGLFFAGSFAAIHWLKYRGLMESLTTANRLIARDESSHCETCILLYSKLIQKLPESIVHSIYKEAIAIEKEFMTKSLPVDLLGMNKDKMVQHLEFIADHWISKLGYNKIYNSSNPFPFTETAEFENKGNMFEIKNVAYSKSGVATNAEENKIRFDMDV